MDESLFRCHRDSGVKELQPLSSTTPVTDAFHPSLVRRTR
jgi:hypothetical protein